MPHNNTFGDEGPYLRLRAIGHTVGCTCEFCFVFVERAINRYLPGFFPADPMELRLQEAEVAMLVLRSENERLRQALKAAAVPTEPRQTQPADNRSYRGVALDVT